MRRNIFLSCRSKWIIYDQLKNNFFYYHMSECYEWYVVAYEYRIHMKNDHIINNHIFSIFKIFPDEKKYIGLCRIVSVRIMMSRWEQDYISFFLFALDSRNRYKRSNFILWFVYELSNLLATYFQNHDVGMNYVFQFLDRRYKYYISFSRITTIVIP